MSLGLNELVNQSWFNIDWAQYFDMASDFRFSLKEYSRFHPLYMIIITISWFWPCTNEFTPGVGVTETVFSNSPFSDISKHWSHLTGVTAAQLWDMADMAGQNGSANRVFSQKKPKPSLYILLDTCPYLCGNTVPKFRGWKWTKNSQMLYIF